MRQSTFLWKYEVRELSRALCLEKFSMGNIVAGFRDPGLLPFDRNTFCPADISAALVTDSRLLDKYSQFAVPYEPNEVTDEARKLL